MGNTAVLVFVAPSLPDVLRNGQSYRWGNVRRRQFTDFVTGAFGINEGWKLNTPLESSTMKVLPWLVLLWADMGLFKEFGSEALRGRVVVA